MEITWQTDAVTADGYGSWKNDQKRKKKKTHNLMISECDCIYSSATFIGVVSVYGNL